MHPLADHDSRSSYDAAARLRYVRGVRERARRAALAPSLALVVLGTVLLAHGLLRMLWPHTALVSIIFLATVFAIRPVFRWLIARSEERRGLQSLVRLRLFCGAAGLLGVAIAIVTGASPLISPIAAAAAAAAYLSGLPALSASVIAAAILGDMMIARGIPLSAGEFIIGAGLVCIGVLGHAKERDQS